MKIELVRKQMHDKTPSYTTLWGSGIILGIMFICVAYVAYHYGVQQASKNASQTVFSAITAVEASTNHAIQKETVHTLIQRIGQLQAELVKLDTLGNQLVDIAKLDAKEFDFNTEWDDLLTEEQIIALESEHGILEEEARKTQLAEIKKAKQLAAKEKKNAAKKALTVASLKKLKKATSRISRQVQNRKDKIETVERTIVKRRAWSGVLPTGWPVRQGKVTSHFGMRHKRMHKGVDIAAPRGTEIYAVEGGVVTFAGRQRGYGKVIVVKHSDTYITKYAHNSKNFVAKGETVSRGQLIGLVGATGRASGAHVHFEVRESGKAINPIRYLSAIGTFRLSENK